MSLSSKRLANIFAFLIPSLLAGIAYIGALSGPFQFDDKKALLYRLNLHQLSDLKSIFLFDPYLPRPLFYLSMAFDWRLWNGRPFGFHLTNVLLHMAVVIVLFDVFRRMTKGNIVLSSLAATIFAVHPAVTESVTYIWSRSSVLSALFFLVSLDLYIVSLRGKAGRAAIYLCSLAAFTLALASKEIAATLPAMLILIELGSDASQRRFLRTVPYFLIVISELAARGAILGNLTFDFNGSYFHYLLTQINVSAAYTGILFWPVHLTVDHFVPSAFPWWQTLASGILLMAFGAVAVKFWRRSEAALGIAWFFVALTPFLFIPLKDQMVERNLYYPAMGFALAVAAALWVLYEKRPREAVALSLVLILSLLTGTIARNQTWKTEKGLWVDAMTNSPAKARPRNYLGALYLNEGNIREAKWLVEAALRKDPSYSEAHHNMGVIALNAGYAERASYEFAMARMGSPGMVEAYTNQAKAELKLGNVEKARGLLERALKLNPADNDARVMLADILRRAGDTTQSRKLYEQATSISPDSYEGAMGLALIAEQEGRREDAMKLIAVALKINPSRSEAHRALGRIYAQQNDWLSAAAEFDKALEADPDNPDLYADIGIAYLRANRLDDARRAFIKEMQLKPGDPEPLLRLASIEEARGNTPDAIKLYHRALILDRKGRYKTDVESILKRLKAGNLQ